MRKGLLVGVCAMIAAHGNAFAQGDGLLHSERRSLFPIGFYELPQDDAALKAMAEAGVNLVRCGNRSDLDRVAAAGLYGWVSLGVHQGATEALRDQISAVVDHPALQIWEGPDEIVWHFTTASTLETEGIGKDDWWDQRDHAVAYAEGKAA